MNQPNPALQRMDDYLKVIRESLRGLPKEDAEDIVEELRSHIRDSGTREGMLVEDQVAAALDRLGPPRELAAQFVVESLTRRAARSRSPWLILQGTYRWAAVSLQGVFTFAVCLLGYALSLPLVLAALRKPFAPDRVGLWRLEGAVPEYSLRLGFGDPVQGAELLGWWVLPLGLLGGVGLFLLTSRFGHWSLRRFSRQLPGATPTAEGPDG